MTFEQRPEGKEEASMHIPGREEGSHGENNNRQGTITVKECQGHWEERACCILAVVLRKQEEHSSTPPCEHSPPRPTRQWYSQASKVVPVGAKEVRWWAAVHSGTIFDLGMTPNASARPLTGWICHLLRCIRLYEKPFEVWNWSSFKLKMLYLIKVPTFCSYASTFFFCLWTSSFDTCTFCKAFAILWENPYLSYYCVTLIAIFQLL